MPDVVIVNSGVANLASITSAFRRLGTSVVVTDDPGVVAAARRVVLPGVGAFGAGLAALRAGGAGGLDRAIAEAVARGTPLLGVCLGMQMLCEGSEESRGGGGLGVSGGGCRGLPDEGRVPPLGGNAVTAVSQAGLVDSGVAAFANSYALREAPPGWTPAWTTHGVRFVAALERGRILACQFHPELSGAYGAALLERWLAGAKAPPSAPADEGPAPGLLPRVVPCLDVKHGRVVKGVRFQNLRDAGDPAEQGALYESQGADEIVVLDVAASPEGRGTQIETVERVRAAIRIPLTVGGGARRMAGARTWRRRFARARTPCSRRRCSTTATTPLTASRPISPFAGSGCGDDRPEHRPDAGPRGAAPPGPGPRAGRRRPSGPPRGVRG